MAFAKAGRARLSTAVRRGTAVGAVGAVTMLVWGCVSASSIGAAPSHARRASAPAIKGPLPAAGTPARSVRPNIVFVLTDDLAWNLVRYMPHVLAMERQGETFTNYFVTDSLCCPSRASILTGRFPHDTRVFDNSPPEGGYAVFHERGEERSTFAAALQRVGYRTALMGKYLNGYQPAATEGGATPYVPPGWNEWDVAGNGYPEYGYRMNSNGHVRSYGYQPKDYLTNVLADKSLGFIEGAAARREPFMLEIATFAPHSPFTPAPRDAGAFPGLRAPRTPAFNVVGSHEPAWLSDFALLGAGQVGAIDRQFRRRAQAVQAVDRMIGRIEAELAAKGLAQQHLHRVQLRQRPAHGRAPAARGQADRLRHRHQGSADRDRAGRPRGADGGLRWPRTSICVRALTSSGARGCRRASTGTAWWRCCTGGPCPAGAGRSSSSTTAASFGRADPDLPTQGSGNPPSYEAIRTPHSLYVEYGTANASTTT